jgi:hypothetical protein
MCNDRILLLLRWVTVYLPLSIISVDVGQPSLMPAIAETASGKDGANPLRAMRELRVFGGIQVFWT